jgi:hypothetical protein
MTITNPSRFFFGFNICFANKVPETEKNMPAATPHPEDL